MMSNRARFIGVAFPCVLSQSAQHPHNAQNPQKRRMKSACLCNRLISTLARVEALRTRKKTHTLKSKIPIFVLICILTEELCNGIVCAVRDGSFGLFSPVPRAHCLNLRLST